MTFQKYLPPKGDTLHLLGMDLTMVNDSAPGLIGNSNKYLRQEISPWRRLMFLYIKEQKSSKINYR